MTRARRNQGGYALLLVVFLTALLVVGTMSIGLRVLTEGKREKEQEMIWRGKQYTRGIKLYYRKLGRFPTTLDDLTKPKIGNIRFMRQAYKDPMNKEDGSWRLIYVGPAGQLIGSLNPNANSVQMPGGPGQPSGAPLNSTVGIGGQSGGGIGLGNTTPGTPGTTPGATGSTPATPATGTGLPGAPGATGTDSQPVPTGDTPTLVGGSIIGIGSKINQPSVIFYEKAHNYRLFEFIWDPSKDLGIGGGPGQQIGTPAGASGQNSSGAQDLGFGAPGQQIGTPPGSPAGAPGQNPSGAKPPQPPNPLNPPPSPPTSIPPNPSQP